MEGFRIVGPEISFQDENGVIARLHDAIEVDEKEISVQLTRKSSLVCQTIEAETGYDLI